MRRVIEVDDDDDISSISSSSSEEEEREEAEERKEALPVEDVVVSSPRVRSRQQPKQQQQDDSVASSSDSEEAKADSEAEEDEDDDEEELTSVKVVVRIRPLLQPEVKRGGKRTALVSDTKENVVHLDQIVENKKKKAEKQIRRRTFGFDAVLDKEDGQDAVFEKSGIGNMIDAVLDGYDATVFAYGQTGSGKTYTMEGYNYEHVHGRELTDVNVNIRETDDSQLGIVPKTTSYLFERLRDRAELEDVDYRVRCSYVQIYNEKILDLLNPGHWISGSKKPARKSMDRMLESQDTAGLRMRFHSASGQFYVENLFEYECENSEDLMCQFEKGVRTKVMGSHKLNAQSSRSHCLFTIHVDIMDGNEVKFSSRLSLIDLAGSERVSLTGAAGKTLKEATCINKSLFALRNVISAISAQQNSDGSSSHVPFRDSKLTSLLQHSLGGTSHTLMIACVSPNDIHLDENLSTLSYAARANQIKNRPKRNEDAKSRLIRKLRLEIKLLKKQLQHAQTMSTMNLRDSQSALTSGPGYGSMSSSSKAGSQRFHQKLKQELLNSITMMKKMHEIELELRDRMEEAEQEVQDMQRDHGKLLSENQRLREHEQVLLHLLDSKDGAGDGGSEKSSVVAKQLLELKQENARLRDSLATAKETASRDLFAHEYAAAGTGQALRSGKSAAAAVKAVKALSAKAVNKKKKKKRKPKVMSVDELRSLLSGGGGGAGSEQVQQRNKRPSSKALVPRSSPRRPLLLKPQQAKPDETRIESSDKGTVVKKAKETPFLPKMNTGLLTNTSHPAFGSNHPNPSPSTNNLGAVNPVQKMASLTELLRTQSRLKTDRLSSFLG